MDPNRQNPPGGPNKPGDDKRPGGSRWTALIIAIVFALIAGSIFNLISGSQYTQTTYSDFLNAIEQNQLSEVQLQYDRIIYLTKEEAAKPANQQKACYTGLPSGGNTMELAAQLDAMGVVVDREIVEDNSTIMMILSYALMLGVAFLFMNMLTKRMSGDGMMGGFGSSKAKVYMEKQTGVTFKDVAGQDEAKESLNTISFLS